MLHRHFRTTLGLGLLMALARSSRWLAVARAPQMAQADSTAAAPRAPLRAVERRRRKRRAQAAQRPCAPDRSR